MSKILFFLIISIKFLVGSSFDPSKIDYCNNVTCKIKGEQFPSTACYCVPGNDRTYVTDNMQEFRQLMLDEQNKYRNQIARGGEKERNLYEPAANMHILKYDLELEHLARCYIMRSNFSHGHDPCRQVSYCTKSPPGQNLVGVSITNPDAAIMLKLMDSWYDELTLIPENKRKDYMNKLVNGHDYGHFTQLIWAKHQKVGCARVRIPNNPYRIFKFVLLCNYAGPNNECGGNSNNKSVYLAGEPCSQCGDTKCNKDLGGKYEALCGEDVKAPDDPPASLAEGETTTQKGDGNRRFVNKFFIVFTIIFSVLYE